jgi:cytochrome c oxidase subunit 1
MVYAIASIAFLSFIVWAHHMFTVGMPLAAQISFMLTTMLIAVPTGVKVFNWVATMWGGSLTFEPPMPFAIAFIVLFSVGGFSGLMLAIVPADYQYQDTYFVVAHFHYVLVTGSIFAMQAAVYYWLSKWTGHMYDLRLAKWHFWLSAIIVNLLFFPQHFLGLAGMPRRIPDYATQFTDWNMISSIGGFVYGISQLLFPYIIWKSVRGGAEAGNRAWEPKTGTWKRGANSVVQLWDSSAACGGEQVASFEVGPGVLRQDGTVFYASFFGNMLVLPTR